VKRKTVLITIIIFLFFVSLVAGVQVVKVAKANFISLPTKPITDPPTLIMQSPINNCPYSETSVRLNIMVIKPASWGPSEDPSIYHDCGISYIHYILDGTSYSLFQAQLINPIGQDLLPTISNFSESLKGLTNGAHSLQVIIYALSQWCPDNSGPFGSSVPPFYFYNMTVTSEIIHFTVGLQTTPSSSPTLTPTPTSSPSPTTSIIPTISPTQEPTQSTTPTPTLTPTPTQPQTVSPSFSEQPTSAPPDPDGIQPDLWLYATVVIVIVAAVAAIGFYKSRKATLSKNKF